MGFDKENDKIAITVPRFSLTLSQDGTLFSHRKNNEPYLVTLAVDSRGRDQPKINFNTAYYPNVRQGDEITMLGDGHLVYAPANPGEWVAVSVLLMESDEDVRRRGEKLQETVKMVASEQGLATALKANPTVAAVSAAVFSVGKIVARLMKGNGDDQVLRAQGTFLRDSAVPYDVNRCVTKRNREASIDIQVIPLEAPNGQGPATKELSLV